MLWMKLTARPAPSIAPIQIVSAGGPDCGQGKARAGSISAASVGQGRIGEEVARVHGHPRRVGDVAVAHQEGALGRFDQPMDMGEAVRLC